jgi:NADH:ubiquinone reductase (H+-translocating)
VARQAGAHVARLICGEVADPRPNVCVPFVYVDKGQMVTLGRGHALAQFQRKQLSGRAAWWVWLLAHIYYLIGFGNRLGALFTWARAYVGFRRGARVITADGLESSSAQAAFHELDEQPLHMAR